MTHVREGALRRFLDEPLVLSEDERRHVRECARCRETQQSIAADASFAFINLTSDHRPVDMAAARSRLHARLGDVTPARSGAAPWHRLRERLTVKPLAALAGAAALVAVAAATPAGSAAAGSLAHRFIAVFQPNQVVEVPITAGELQTLPDLRQFGTIRRPSTSTNITVTSAAQASRKAGMTVAQLPDAARFAPGTKPSYQLLPRSIGSFTFSARKAAAAAKASGKSLPDMPPGVNGSTLRVTVGPAVVTSYGVPHNGIPLLVIAQMRAPVIQTSGVSLSTLEDYVLGLPGVSPQLAVQIKALGNPTTSLPIPIPVDRVDAHSVTVQGAKGLAVSDSTGIGSGVVWERQGIIYGVAGSLTGDGIITAANSLR